jgi:hypothetical protein
MDHEQSHRLKAERGMVTVQYVLASACALVLLVLTANLLVDLYVRAAVRDALDEGVRAAVPIGTSLSDCAAKADDTLHGLVRGAFANGVTVRCGVAGGRVTADADVALPAFLALFPSWTFRLHAEARQETEDGPP